MPISAHAHAARPPPRKAAADARRPTAAQALTGRLRCACGGGCPGCSGVSLGGAPALDTGGGTCGTTPGGGDLGPTNALGRDGQPRRRPRLCKVKFRDTALSLNTDRPGLRGNNRGVIEFSAPDGLVAALSGCSADCLEFRQFVKVRTFEDGVATTSPLQSCGTPIPRTGQGSDFVEEHTPCFTGGAPGAGIVSWHDAPGTLWADPATEPQFALFDFTVRVMAWDRCLGEPAQTIEGRIVLRKNGEVHSAEITPFVPVPSTFAYFSPGARCP